MSTRKKGKSATDGGRRYTLALGRRVCEMVSEGAGLNTVARELGVPRRTLAGWIRKYARLAEEYGAACTLRLGYMEDRLAELCARSHDVAVSGRETTKAEMEAIKQEIDVVKWQLVKLLPAKYGEQSRLELNAQVERLLPQHTREEDEAFAALVAAAQARTQREEARDV